MSKLRTYQVSGGAHTSVHGFVNYIGGASKERLQEVLKQVFVDHPGAVVLDGDDDWYASQSRSPGTFPRIFEIEPLAWFHTGISGISKSGIVVTREDFEKMEREFPTKTFTQIRKPERTDCVLRECVTVYEEGA